jgi:DNA-binding transcriptional ArsR family regulator
MTNSLGEALGVLAHAGRMDLINWLREPKKHFPAQKDGDLERDGACGVLIAKKWGVAQPTASRHLKLMVDADLLIATRKKGWTFYRRNEAGIAKLQAALTKRLGR